MLRTLALPFAWLAIVALSAVGAPVTVTAPLVATAFGFFSYAISRAPTIAMACVCVLMTFGYRVILLQPPFTDAQMRLSEPLRTLSWIFLTDACLVSVSLIAIFLSAHMAIYRPLLQAKRTTGIQSAGRN
jgi:hypothetical protein